MRGRSRTRREGIVAEGPRDCVAERKMRRLSVYILPKPRLPYVCVTDTERRNSDEVDWQRQRHVLMVEEEGDHLGGKGVLRTGTEREGER